MATPTIITFTGASGGVGTTTQAVNMAMVAARREIATLLIDATGTNDTYAAFGGAHPSYGEFIELSPSLHAVTCAADSIDDHIARRPDTDLVIIDTGRDLSISGKRVVVIRNDYISMRHLVGIKNYDAIVVTEYPHSAMSWNDAAAVASAAHDDMFTIGLDPAIQRSVDAGLFHYRRTAELQRLGERLLNKFVTNITWSNA